MGQGVSNPNPYAGMSPGSATGSPWEANMAGRLARGTPEDALMQQLLMRHQQGPQFQGSGQIGDNGGYWGPAQMGPPGNRMAQFYPAGEQMQRVGNAMAYAPGVTPGPGAGRNNPAAMKAGYQASKPTQMDQLYRQTKPKVEQPKWMGRK